MSKRVFAKLLLGSILLVTLSGCATYPISASLRKIARQDLTLPVVQANAQAYAGSMVIWGGFVIETDNTSEGSEIIVLDTPLKGLEEPRAAAYSPGRFIVKTTKFLDPVVYKKGKKITVAGEIAGIQTRPLGKTQYTYPVLDAKQLTLWSEEKVYLYEPYYYWDYWPAWPGDDFFSEHLERHEHHEAEEHER